VLKNYFRIVTQVSAAAVPMLITELDKKYDYNGKTTGWI
jgi:hypothetical protein